MSKINVSIIGSAQIIIDGFVKIIESAEDMKILQCYNNYDNILDRIKTNMPDVMIIDDSYFDKNDICELTNKLLLFPVGKRIIVYTDGKNMEYHFNLISRGIRGILNRTVTKEKVIKAINQICSGGIYYDSFIIDKKDIKEKTESVNPIELLTKREKQILKQISLGRKNKEIAKNLFISCGTVEVHKNNLLKKLSLNSTNELIIYAISRREYFD
jgi:DNA-binding NarL/FixJ family response regulator